MTCYMSNKKGAFSFCIQTDTRPELPLIVDPLESESRLFEFDLLGRSINEKLALEQIGQTAITQDVLNFVNQNSILISCVLPLAIPMLHYGAKLLAMLTYNFCFFADLHRILLGPFWRAVFRLPKDPTLHPSYTMYVYCCDLLCISCPEPDEFFDVDNYTQFMRIAWLINPLGFNVVNKDLLRQIEAEREARESWQAEEAEEAEFDYQ